MGVPSLAPLAQVYAGDVGWQSHSDCDLTVMTHRVDEVTIFCYVMCSCLSPRSWIELTEGFGTDGIETLCCASHGLADGHAPA